jgi:hypothetical protein
MKYIAHLVSGGTVELELPDDNPNLFDDQLWLVDDNGVMVNMTHCAALVPDLTPASSTEPAEDEIDFKGAAFVDVDDERWYPGETDGMYRIESGEVDHSKEKIERKWGPLTYPKVEAKAVIDFRGAAFVDVDGDRWYLCPNGYYSLTEGDVCANDRKSWVEDTYGPLTYPKAEAVRT